MEYWSRVCCYADIDVAVQINHLSPGNGSSGQLFCVCVCVCVCVGKQHSGKCAAVEARTAAELDAECGEAPNVAQVDREADDGEKEVDLFAPLVSALGALVLCAIERDGRRHSHAGNELRALSIRLRTLVDWRQRVRVRLAARVLLDEPHDQRASH